MGKIPKTMRFFRHHAHISFLVGYGLILIGTGLESFEIKLASTIFFLFTLGYEIYEISLRETKIWQVDHMIFVVAIALLSFSFWNESLWLLILVVLLISFTLGWDIYRERQKDLENDISRI